MTLGVNPAGLYRKQLSEAADFHSFLSVIYGAKNQPSRGISWAKGRVDSDALSRDVPPPTVYPDLPQFEQKQEAAKPVRTNPVRVLCLHGTCASSAVFKKQLARMQSLLKGKIELVYTDGPIKANGNTPGFNEMQMAFKNMEFFDYAKMADWTAVTPELEELRQHMPDPGAVEGYLRDKPEEHWRVCPERKYEELDDALAYLQEELKAKAPIDGVMGFGGGANMANLLAAQAACGQGAQFTFAIHLCPGKPGWVEQRPDLFASPIKMRCLCISAQRDLVNPPDALKDLYEDAQCYMHEDGQRPIPGTSAEEANYIAGIIVDFIMEEFSL
mmetsp:Transcript_77749/g.174002  ORF Transcript_77749/g.174002 Transcript_77749/m.174002 type:complete len:329 (-) Transcript_77749:131-1117(-)